MPPKDQRYGSDLIAQMLSDLDIEYVACAPGATFRGLHDSLVNLTGDSVPQLVECLHEEVSVAIAHGYAKAAGKPMMAALHDVVGLQHASMAIFNAWCDRVPVLLFGATGPMDATKRRPWIDWIHTANVQATQVRDYTKWDDQPASIAAVPEALIRADQIARAQPCGPTYVCVDVEIQEGEVPDEVELPDLSRFAAPTTVSPAPTAIAQLADWLLAAERPVVVADLVGRDPAAFDLLADLAELLALPVIDREADYNKVSLNFPTQHPMNLSGSGRDHLAPADLVLGLECIDLFGALHEMGEESTFRPVASPDARVVHITMSHFITSSWSADFQRLQPADLHIPSELYPALEALLAVVREHLEHDESAKARIADRRPRLEAVSSKLRANWREEAEARKGGAAISWPQLALELGDVLEGCDIVVANGHLGNWVHRLWDLDAPHQYLGGSGGAGLGYGLSAAIGAALAHRDTDRIIVNIQSDGDALFTPEALWTASKYRLPILTVMDNNRAFNNSVEHAARVAAWRSRPMENMVVGTAIDDPSVDFATLAHAFGMYGAGPIQSEAELRPALEKALLVVRDERLPALVDVVTQRRTPAL